MEEGGLNDIATEVLHGCLIFRRDAITAEDLESGMTPVGEHGDQVSCDSPFGQKHLEDPVPENRLQLFQVQRRSDPEHALPIEASVRHQDMAVGLESEEVAKGLDGDDGAGDGILLRHRLLKKELQGFPGAAAQIGKKIPVIEKIPPQDLRDAEDDMSVGNLLEYVGTEPFPEFHHPLLMARGTEMTALAGEGQKIFMVAIPALHPGKAMLQVATVQVAVNDLLEVGPPEPERPFKPLLIDLNKGNTQ